MSQEKSTTTINPAEALAPFFVDVPKPSDALHAYTPEEAREVLGSLLGAHALTPERTYYLPPQSLVLPQVETVPALKRSGTEMSWRTINASRSTSGTFRRVVLGQDGNQWQEPTRLALDIFPPMPLGKHDNPKNPKIHNGSILLRHLNVGGHVMATFDDRVQVTFPHTELTPRSVNGFEEHGQALAALGTTMLQAIREVPNLDSYRIDTPATR